MISRDMEKTIVSALDEYNGFVRYSGLTEYHADGMIVYDDRQPVCYLTMEEWDEFSRKYKDSIKQISTFKFKFKTADEMK